MPVEDIAQWWSFLFLGVFIYAGLQQFKTQFPGVAGKLWVQRSMGFVGPTVSMLIAMLPIFPMPDSLGNSIGTRALFGLVAGICCSWSYKAFKRLAGADTKSTA